MRFCIRQRIDFQNSNARLAKLNGVAVELAFPHDLEEFLQGTGSIGHVESQVKSHGVSVYSVHAPDGHLSDETFIDWAGKVVQFAEAVGASVMVLHPEKISETRNGNRDAVIGNIQHLQDRTKVTIGVETFWGAPRVLSPDAIMQSQLPMVLDTSYLPKPEILWVIESYHTHIVNLHLSAVTRDRKLKGFAYKHQPVDRDGFCMDILDRLQ
ncbi:MAG: hypothetical protein M0042_03165, partial [Nitrospiraceae bacterium]|nr:hypothetical protein [Nitrospiraceae bacterium]